MSAKKATEQAVFAAADQLWASGEEPSYESVISLTGGSTETVGPYLKTWLARPRAAQAPTPDSIAVQGRVFLASVWTSALKQAHAELEQQRKDASADAVLAREEHGGEARGERTDPRELQRDGHGAVAVDEAVEVVQHRGEVLGEGGDPLVARLDHPNADLVDEAPVAVRVLGGVACRPVWSEGGGATGSGVRAGSGGTGDTGGGAASRTARL